MWKCEAGLALPEQPDRYRGDLTSGQEGNETRSVKEGRQSLKTIEQETTGASEAVEGEKSSFGGL